MKINQLMACEPTIFLLKKLWQFAGERRKLIFVFCGMLVLGHSLLLVTPLIFGALISELQTNGVSHDNFPYLVFLLLLIFLKDLGFWALHGPARVIERMVAFSAELNFRKYLMEGVLSLGLSWHADHDSGDTIDKVNKAGTALSEFGQNTFQILQVMVKLLGTSAVLVWFSPWIGLTVLLFVIGSFLFIFQFDRKLVPQYRRLNEFSNKASAAVFDSLSNITSVKILHIEQPILRGVMARYAASRVVFRKNAILNELKWFSSSMMFQVIGLTPVAVFIYYQLSVGKAVDVGQVSTLYLYLSDLIFVYYSFGSFYEQFAQHKNRVLNAEPIERAFHQAQTLRKASPNNWQHLVLEDIHFSYGGKLSEAHLNGMSLSISRGQRIAIIGESGSGKTTLLKVIHGMYKTAQGTVRFDQGEKIITTFSDLDLRTMLVPQEPEVFSQTIRENITLGLERDESAVMHAVRLAVFDNVVAKLPQGLDSVINEKGVNLSGGQKQRLALARALLFAADKDLLLLDESTSSVDSENELEIYQNIWQKFRAKTIIASIHKLNLLKFFDEIVIVENGLVSARGSLEELLRQVPTFRKSFEEFMLR